jgi:hypothetical protein
MFDHGNYLKTLPVFTVLLVEKVIKPKNELDAKCKF